MIEQIRGWLNSSDKNYTAGCALYKVYGQDSSLQRLFSNPSSDYTRQRLFEALRGLFLDLKENESVDTPIVTPRKEETDLPGSEELSPVQAAALVEANNHWKELMALRGYLFGLVRDLPVTDDPNKPEHVEKRGEIALQILQLAKKTDDKYDALAYAMEHNKTISSDISVSDDYAHIPDSELRNTVQNIQKNVTRYKRIENRTAAQEEKLQYWISVYEKIKPRWNCFLQKS